MGKVDINILFGILDVLSASLVDNDLADERSQDFGREFLHNPGMSDTQLRQLITAHIDEDEFCRYVIQRDINGIALALRETHKDDFFSVPEDNPLKEMLETAGEIVSQDSDTEQAYLAFICKRLKLNFRKLSVEERKWLKKIAEKSDLLKNPKPQRGRR